MGLGSRIGPIVSTLPSPSEFELIPMENTTRDPRLEPGSQLLHQRVAWALWVVLLILIPITSSPILARWMGETPVSPLAIIPMLLLIPIWVIPFFWNGGKLPGNTRLLIVFTLWVLFTSAIAFALPVIPYKGQSIITREIRAIGTLFIGLGFYFCAVTLRPSERALQWTLRALYLGAVPMLIWSTAQAWLVLDGSDRLPLWMTRFHHIFSIRDYLPDRVTGFAFEPSWLGDQLVILFLPLWFASVFTGVSVWRSKKKVFSMELIFAVWGFVILLLTRSRISLISFFLVATISALVLTWKYTDFTQRSFFAHRLQMRRFVRVGLRPAILLLVMIGIILGAFSSAWLASKVDSRLRSVMDIPSLLTEIKYYYPNEEGFEIANRLAFAERVVYWTASYRLFERYPVMGVGLGNAGFFFEELFPSYGERLTEIRILLAADNPAFPNPKSLWFRLLSETGFVGFVVFIMWLILLAIGAWSIRSDEKSLKNVVALAGLLGLGGFIGEGFSLDTFALPHFWILTGLITAVIWDRSADILSAGKASDGGMGKPRHG